VLCFAVCENRGVIIVLGGLSALLALAGLAKLLAPEAASALLSAAGLPHARVAVTGLAAGELGVGIAGLVLPGHIGGALVAAAFGCLAVGSGVVRGRAGNRPCGCFGDVSGVSLGLRHVIANAAAAIGAAAAAVLGSPGLSHRFASGPVTATLTLAAELVLAAGLSTLMRSDGATANSAAVRLAESSARLLGPSVTRRSALVRIAVGGSAVAIAPLRYLLYPGTAMAVVAPSSCDGGLCTDGYTAFCCEITDGGVNACPAGTFAGGWWMCTDYEGHQLCEQSGIRFYIDCNALPGTTFPGGCQCAGGSCDHRSVACNVGDLREPEPDPLPELQQRDHGRQRGVRARGELPGASGGTAPRRRRGLADDRPRDRRNRPAGVRAVVHRRPAA
jgi:hypothetical protein